MYIVHVQHTCTSFLTTKASRGKQLYTTSSRMMYKSIYMYYTIMCILYVIGEESWRVVEGTQ